VARGAVAHAHGTVAAEAGPIGQRLLVQDPNGRRCDRAAPDPIRVRARDVEQEAHEILALVELPEQAKSAEHIRGIAQPAVAIVPGAPALGCLGNGRRHGRDDGARVLETVQLERERGANDLVLKDRRNIAVLDPALPVAPRLHQESLGQWRQRLFHRRAVGQHQVSPLGEREGAPVEIRQRNVGGQAHLTGKPS
jgi:hypothetical protein